MDKHRMGAHSYTLPHKKVARMDCSDRSLDQRMENVVSSEEAWKHDDVAWLTGLRVEGHVTSFVANDVDDAEIEDSANTVVRLGSDIYR
ncbi:hypothetical protein ACS0TY_011693 [Phlomoides rotata]